MTLKRLRLRNLLYHWRGNSAVFLGVVVGTAVLTGALLVGDSLRGSLRELALARLGWVDRALVAPRFFRQELAEELVADGAAERAWPVILLQATAVVRQKSGEGLSTGTIRRQVRGVTVLGVDDHFWQSPSSPSAGKAKANSLCLNRALAAALDVSDGDEVSLRLQKPSAIPRESLLGKRDDSAIVEEWTLPVGCILSERDFGDRFSLRPDLEAPRNVFVPLRLLQDKLGLEKRCNAIFVSEARPELAKSLRSHLRLDDWGLVLKKARRDYLSLESRQLLLEGFVSDAALETARELNMPASPTLVYLANTIAAGGKEIPYSVVAALDPTLSPPLGPFLPPGVKKLADDQIVLVDWKESPLPTKTGEMVTLKYFPPTHQGEWHDRSATFRLAGLVPLQGETCDPDLTPDFPGITDKLRISEWDPPFPYDNARIKPRDERYWQKYRAAPKAFVNLVVGQRLWGSRFGRVTSIRLAANGDRDLEESGAAFEKHLLTRLDPAKGGLVFNPVREQALQASGGGTDFAELFLYFSFFLIVAALLLVGLLFRLNVDRRAEEIGLLLSVGYRHAAVRRLLLGEGCVIAAVGAVVGSCLAMLYALLLLKLLAALWPGETLQSFLTPHFSALSLIMGAGGAFLVSVLTVAWAVFSLGRVAPSTLLAGQLPGEGERLGHRRRCWGWWIAGACAIGACILLAFSGRVQDHEMRAMTFFGSGSLLLAACLSALWGWMRSTRHRTVEGHGLWSVAQLGIRNAARHPGRSLLTAGLIASAAFLIVAVESFRRRVDAHEAVDLANGGYALVAESDLPLFRDLNTAEARDEIENKLELVYRDESGGDNVSAQRRAKQAIELVEQTRFVAFRVHAGDDASCLNLYQPLRPRLLGVPVDFIDKQKSGFLFAATSAHTDAERADPWTLLLPASEDVPAFGEKNTVEWMLKSKLNGTVALPPDTTLRIEGLLSDSVFQSSLLVSEPNFLRLYPGQEGYQFFLIRPPAGKEREVKNILELAFAERGFQATPTLERLNSYLAVENTYLSTFQALGGLGLLLGSLGLAVVLLRGVWERCGELALLRALGYRHATLGWLILAENAFLLLMGLLAGTLSALVAVAPYLWSGGGAIPWTHLLALLLGVILVGLSAGALATISTLRAPLILALRRE
jgi:ABC-type lipoprotein release transport system permease subunit